MPLLIEPASLTFSPEGTPVSERYGDVYHSAAGGHEQARHVFLEGNGLPLRWQGQDSFSILETGFGLGLNFMATWLSWRNDPQRCRTLEFISVEKHPFGRDDLAAAHSAWPEFAELSATLCAGWPPLVSGEHRIELDRGECVLRLIFGDAAECLPRLDAKVDAIYLDGFSPARNPDLWSPDICRALARVAKQRATLATWSVAGVVRQSLAAEGFALDKRPGFAGKRQMLVGTYVSEQAAVFCDQGKKA